MGSTQRSWEENTIRYIIIHSFNLIYLDLYGESLAPSGAEVDQSNIFNNMFGYTNSASNQTAPSQNYSSNSVGGKSPKLKFEIEVSLEDVYKGKVINYQYEKKIWPDSFNAGIYTHLTTPNINIPNVECNFCVIRSN